MNRKYISIIIIGLVFVILAGIFFIVRNNLDFINQFRSFTVTIDNQSDYDIVTVETGVITSDSLESKDLDDSGIQSGKKLKVTPNLKLTGVGRIYIKYTDSRGEVTNKSICSYTESLSGYSNVIIQNDNVKIEEHCN